MLRIIMFRSHLGLFRILQVFWVLKILRLLRILMLLRRLRILMVPTLLRFKASNISQTYI